MLQSGGEMMGFAPLSPSYECSILEAWVPAFPNDVKGGSKEANALCRRAAAERGAVWGHAVPDGGGADLDFRHHERHQPGARLAVHARGLRRRRELCRV